MPFTCARIHIFIFCISNDNENDGQSVSEKPIKVVHLLQPGEREYLSPNLIGVQNIASTFLPLTMNFINVIDAYREIVNGIRYEILLNAINTEENDAEIVCRLIILEKPWLRTQWGDKVRDLQYSNCTSSAATTDSDIVDNSSPNRANNINDKYVKSTVFNGGSRNELSDVEIKRLEDQIFPSAISSKRNDRNHYHQPILTTTIAANNERNYDESDDAMTSTESSQNDIETTTIASSNEMSLEETETSSTSVTPELNEDDKQWLDNFFSIGALNFENSLRDATLSSASSSSSSSSSSLSPSLSSSSRDTDENVEIASDASDNNKQQQREPEQQNVNAPLQRSRRSPVGLTGGISELDHEEAEKRLNNSLEKLAAGDGPTFSCDLADGDNKEERCDVEIWSQPWLSDGTEVTINCPSKQLIKQRHSRSVLEYAEKKTHKKAYHHNLNKIEHLFAKFQIKFKRNYHTTMEKQMRFRIFKQNLQLIEELNRNEQGSAKYGITEFADMTSPEYKQRTGLWQRDPQKAASNPKADIPNIDLPKEFDWREKGVISSGLHAVKTGVLEEYSEQELLDCDTSDSACNGGLPDNAFEAIEKIGGLELESEYPYHARKEQCHFNGTKTHVKVKGHVDLPKNETAMAQWLITNGPISIGINANAMQFYRGGVSHPWHILCSKKNLDHGVLIVGYGVSDYPMFKKTLPYWIIKNSWGKKWGEQGFYRVYRGDNSCGVSEMASSAVLDDY
uniref:Cysteine proteinase CG12163 n=1 Tax=Glossina brevipalpis TaxID=37001 RepID=A0A1A9WFU4_9MUSC